MMQQINTFSPFTMLFDSSFHRNLTLSMLLIVLVLFVLKYFESQISVFILEKISSSSEEKIGKNLSFNEFTINKFMSFENVKAHLFYKEDSYFKQKYGSDFNPEYYDMVLLKHEVLEILRKKADPILKKIIVEKIKNLNQVKIIFVIKLVCFVLCFALSLCAGMLFKNLYADFGLLKSLIALCLPLVFAFGLVLALNFFMSSESFKDQAAEENKGNLIYGKENEGLVVLAKQTLR